MNQKFQHTPGPWITGKTDRYHADEVTAHGIRIAQCSARGQSTPQTEANARLIAAAPDLLSACRAVADAADGLLAWYDTESPEYASAEKAVEQARAAITKAEVVA